LQKSKQPYYFRLESQQPFAIAGLWENWISPESEEFSSCTILTTQANPSIASIHDRMPVILNSSDCKLWLNPQIESSELLEELLSSKESNKIEAYPVSSLVNNVRNDSAELLSPL
jgi:putative SOS response-associated peptidase YedK